jgi:arsenate reductase (glutaredoxin)
VELWGLRNCDTCRRARAFLDAQGAAFNFHDLRKQAVPARRVQFWVEAVGHEALLNRRSATWRALAPAERVLREPAEAVALMVAHPTLIRRPVLEAEGAVLVGFRQADWRALMDTLR